MRYFGLFIVCLLATSSAVAANNAASWRSIWLSAEQLPAIGSHRIDKLSLARYRAGHFEPIAFQIDELNKLGLVALGTDLAPLSGKADYFDGKDRLGFMWRDVGAKAPSTARPKSGQLLAAIRVILPDTGTAGRYVYLLAGSSQRSKRRYIHQSLSSGVTSTPCYRLAVNPDNELDWHDFRYRGYAGKGSITDSLRMRMSAHMFSHFTPGVTLGNDNLKPKLLASKQGPIRSIMLMRIHVVLLGIPVMTLYEQVSRYASRYQAVSYTHVPALYRATLKAPRVAVSIVGSALQGSSITTALSGDKAAHVDGSMSQQEKQLRANGIDNRHNWIYFNSHRRFVMMTHLDIPKSLANIPVSLVYDDAKATKKQPALLPNVGYAINAWPQQKVLKFRLDLLFDNDLHGESPSHYLQTRLGQPTFKVTPLTAQTPQRLTQTPQRLKKQG